MAASPKFPSWGRPSLLQIAVIVSFIITAIINAVSNAPSKPFGGQTNGDVSARHKTAFTPAGYAFSIWGVIYTFAAMFCIYQLAPSRREWVSTRVSWFMVLNFVANSVWVIAFCNEWGAVWVSVGIIFAGILAPLVLVYLKMEIGKHDRPITPAELICAHHFVSIYLGWICVASIANVAVAGTPRDGIVDWGWTASNWSILMQCAATSLALAGVATRLDFMFAAPIAWALVAIGVQQRNDAYPGNAAASQAGFALGAIVAIAAVSAAIIRTYWWATGRTKFASADEKSSIGEAIFQPIENGATLVVTPNPAHGVPPRF